MGGLLIFTLRGCFFFYVLLPKTVHFMTAVRLNRRAGARSCRKKLLFYPPRLLLLCSIRSSRGGCYFVRSDKVTKALLSPSRRSAVAVNFSVSSVIEKATLLPSSHRRSSCNVPTNGKIHITTALPEGKAHVQLYLRLICTNESATSDVFIKIRNRLIFPCYFNHRVPDSRNPLRGCFQIYPSSKVVRANVSYRRDTACRVRLQFGAKRPIILHFAFCISNAEGVP